MKLYINTENAESMHLEMTEQEENSLTESIQELTFGLAGLAVDYIQKLDYDPDPDLYHKIRTGIVKLFDSKLTRFIDQVLLVDDQDDDDDIDDDDDDGMEEELYNIRTMMEETESFTEAEIDAAVQLVVDSGGIDTALEYLKQVAKDNHIDLGE